MEIYASLDWLALSLVGVVLGLAGVLVALMWYHAKAFERSMERVTSAAYETAGETTLHRELRRQFVRRRQDGTLLLREAPDVTLEDWLEREIHHHRSFEAGGWLTGIALMGTFFLIALVLARDVGPAISNSSDLGNLSRAVATMGGKFVVSLFGIFGSIIHAVFRGAFIKRLQPTLLTASERLSAESMLVTEFHAETSEASVRTTTAIAELLARQHSEIAQQMGTASQALSATSQSTRGIYDALAQQHADVLKRMAEVKTAVDRLQSIEVSVKDIGSELGKSLQQMVKNDIVDAIGRNLEDMADKVIDALQASFAQKLDEQLALVTDELRKIENAVSSQAQGQVEELLTKLSESVSGGFTSESSRMKDALTRFAEVIPALEQQMRTLLLGAAQDQNQRDVQRTQVSEQLFAQLERVSASMEQQQAAQVKASLELRELSAGVQKNLTQSVAQANEQILERSRLSLQDLTGAVRSATDDAAEVYRGLVKEVSDSASLLREARSHTEASAQSLIQAAGAVQSQVRSLVDRMTTLRAVSEALARASEGSRAAAQDSTNVLRSGQEIIRQQQQFLEDLSARWPELTTQYLAASDQSFSSIATAWGNQARQIEESVSKIGTGFSASATDFATAVEDLSAQVSLLSRAMESGVGARVRST